jgi:hypothetical protein
LGEHLLETRRDPNTTGKVLQQPGLIERGQRGGEPNALERGGLLEEKILLESGQGSPPQAAHTVFIAAARGHSATELFPEGDEVHRQR